MVAFRESIAGEENQLDSAVAPETGSESVAETADTIATSSDSIVAAVETMIPDVRDSTDPVPFQHKVDFVKDLESRLGGIPPKTRREVIKEAAGAVAALIARLGLPLRAGVGSGVAAQELGGDGQ